MPSLRPWEWCDGREIRTRKIRGENWIPDGADWGHAADAAVLPGPFLPDQTVTRVRKGSQSGFDHRGYRPIDKANRIGERRFTRKRAKSLWLSFEPKEGGGRQG